MKCKKCGYEFMGKYCPECGKRADSGGWINVALPLLFAFVFFASIAFLFQNDMSHVGALLPSWNSQNDADANQASSFQTNNGFPQSEDESEPWVPSGSRAAAPGASIEEGYHTTEKDGIYITEFGYQQSYGSGQWFPKPGNVFVTFEFSLLNERYNFASVDGYITAEIDGYIYEPSSHAVRERDGVHEFGCDHVGYGKKVHGVLGYEVPEDWKEAVITFIGMDFHYRNSNYAD